MDQPFEGIIIKPPVTINRHGMEFVRPIRNDVDAGLEAVSNLREHALNQGKIRYVDFKRKDELSQQSRMESVKLEPLRKVSGASYDYSPMPTEIFRTAKEGSLRRLQEAIKYGGLRF